LLIGGDHADFQRVINGWPWRDLGIVFPMRVGWGAGDQDIAENPQLLARFVEIQGADGVAEDIPAPAEVGGGCYQNLHGFHAQIVPFARSQHEAV
jgi:hypothetical protein